MATFFTSDTHFQHKNILVLGDGRPFDGIDHHDEILIANWNSVVSSDDTVYHLGDVALGPWPVGLAKASRLNGHKKLAIGNHDRIFAKESENRRERFRPDYEAVFEEIAEEYDFEHNGIRYRLSHFPAKEVVIGGKGDRFLDFRPEDDGAVIVHGHTHQDRVVTYTDRGTPQISVGVDANSFAPVSLKSIEEHIKEIYDRRT